MYRICSPLIWSQVNWWISVVPLIWLQVIFLKSFSDPFVVQLLNHVAHFATPWTATCEASLSFTISQSLLKLVSTESVMWSNHLILCHPLLLLPSIFPSIRVFSNESALCVSGWSIRASASASSSFDLVWIQHLVPLIWHEECWHLYFFRIFSSINNLKNFVPDVWIPEQEERRPSRQCNWQKGKVYYWLSHGPLPHPTQWRRSASPEPKLLHKFIG